MKRQQCTSKRKKFFSLNDCIDIFPTSILGIFETFLVWTRSICGSMEQTSTVKTWNCQWKCLKHSSWDRMIIKQLQQIWKPRSKCRYFALLWSSNYASKLQYTNLHLYLVKCSLTVQEKPHTFVCCLQNICWKLCFIQAKRSSPQVFFFHTHSTSNLNIFNRVETGGFHKRNGSLFY